MHYNYKNYHSTVLMAMCDAQYRFIYVDIGHYGKDNDASIFGQSQMFSLMENGDLTVPSPKLLGEQQVPHYIVGDEIFPLKPWLMKPYGGKNLSEHQHIFNYRLSRARRTIENSFGILSARWRIYHTAIRADMTTTDLIVKSTIALHNYLLCTDNAHYTPAGFVDSYNGDDLIDGDWRRIVERFERPALAQPPRLAARNYNFEAKTVRDNICKYVNSEDGSVPWQVNHVRSCGPRN